MKTTFGFLFAAFVLIVSGSSFTSIEKAEEIKPWVLLGTKVVNYKLDKDVIHVGMRDGRFNRLKIKVSGGSLNMHKMVVEYGNGSKETIHLKHNFAKGNLSRVINLEGKDRIIRDITFWYDSKNRSKKKAKVHVFGGR